MTDKTLSRRLFLGAAGLLVAAFVSAPVQLGPQGIQVAVAHAIHDTRDGNNGSGDNRNALDGSKVDDSSNPNYDRRGEDKNDGNFGRGDDKKRGSQ